MKLAVLLFILIVIETFNIVESQQDYLFGSELFRKIQPSNSHEGRNRRYRFDRRDKGGKERWKEICRFVHPNPLARPGEISYPYPPTNCPY